MQKSLSFLRSPFGVFGAGVLLVSGLALVLVPGLLGTLFSTGFFMPHIHCYLDDPRMVRLQGVSDFAIGVSYMVISGALAYLVRKARKDLPFEWMILAFGVFIFSCGCTHFLEVWTLWHPTYWLSGAVKAVTGAASLATAAGIIFLLPHIFGLIRTAKASEQRRLDLSKAHEELQRAYTDLETFSYSLSHDIRGPLRAVTGLSQMVLDDYRERLDPEVVATMQRVVKSAHRLDRLVQDVLALSRLAQGPVALERVDLGAVLQQILEGRPDLQPPRAEVRVEGALLPVRGEAGSLSQCLENLLGNAVKFVPRGQKPQVRVYTEAVEGKVRLWVEDNGIGIPREAQQKIFEPFRRLHREQEYEGTGVGLAIVQRAAARMGGRVGVESEPGQGSRFWVELMAAEEVGQVYAA